MRYSIIFWAGLLFLGIGISLFKDRIDFIKQGIITVAIVTELKENRDSDGKSYTPVFRYRTNKKEEILHVHNVSTNPPSWSIGDEAKVVYHKYLPHNCIVLTYFGAFGATVVLLSIALVLLFISGAYYWSNRFFNTLD